MAAAAKPPPLWESLSVDDVARRLASLTTGATPSEIVERCFARDSVFSSGVDAIDRLLPDGGVACGTVLELYGPPASGKSTIARRMAAAFAARACLGVSDWGICFAISNPSAFCPKSFVREVREAIAAASARSDVLGHQRDGHHDCISSCEREKEMGSRNEGAHDMMRRIQVASFATPDELLRFFRFLHQTEFSRAEHHKRGRRLLVVVDSVARIWDSPACGESSHARQWIAAEIIREMRNAVATGNGWRRAMALGEVESAAAAAAGGRVGERGGERGEGGERGRGGGGGGGGVGVVILSGAASIAPRQRGGDVTALPLPIGTHAWLAAAADVRLYVEPLSNASALVVKKKANEVVCGEEEEEEDEESTGDEGIQKTGVSFLKMSLRIHLVKGGISDENCIVTL